VRSPGCAALRPADSLAILATDPAAVAEEIQRRLEAIGFSCFAFDADVSDALAPSSLSWPQHKRIRFRPQTQDRPCENCALTSSPRLMATRQERAGPAGGACRAASTSRGSLSSPRSPI